MLFRRFICPNIECKYKIPLKEGQSCPLCGVVVRKVGFKEGIRLVGDKDGREGILKPFSCPNILCDHVKTLRKNQRCPKCGTLIRRMGFREILKIRIEKDKNRSASLYKS